jgi:uncharacterized protein (DUF2267 family)
MADVRTFDKAIEKASIWVNDVRQELNYEDNQKAYVALRSVLKALRDRLTVEEATDLGGQLPMMIKGIYYDGWDPSAKPVTLRSTQEFYDYMNRELRDDINPERATKAVFKTLKKHITDGEIRHVVGNLPNEMENLWN